MSWHRNASLTVLILCLSALSAFAAPFSLDIDKNVNLQLGTRDFGPINVPNDISECTMSVDRNQFTNPISQLEATIIISGDPLPPDVFSPCELPCTFGFIAKGFATNPSIPLAKIIMQLPPTTNRKVQGTYVVSGARFRSTITVACQ
jgi:hypothetical protein